MKSEKELRGDIRRRVRNIYKLRQKSRKFIPGRTRINYAGRVYDDKEMTAMVDSVLDFWLTLGEQGRKFEDKFAKYIRRRKAIVVNSGSSANLIAVTALCSPNIDNPLKPGDEVITTASTFPTTLAPIVQNGLIPVFVDIELGTYNIISGEIKKALSSKTRAVMFAHTLGNPCKMDEITDIAKKNGLYMIEDACDALGSNYDGKRCGSFGDFSTFSFYAAHHITMGEGGALATDDINLYRQALSIRDWGRACYCQYGDSNPNGACRNRFGFKYEGLPEGYDHRYVYSNIGYNLKPLDIQCAMGLEQVKKLPEFIKRRKRNFKYLYNLFKKYEDKFVLPESYKKSDVSWFAFPLTVRHGAGFTRTEFVKFLESHCIETRMLFAGNILKHPGYGNIKHRIAGSLNNTKAVVEGTFFIGVYPGLTDEMLGYIEKTVNLFLKGKRQ
ncbi:MAG: lipopolysaccharide biosynthesis protein RfbH [Elusimicrobiota bacterium]